MEESEGTYDCCSIAACETDQAIIADLRKTIDFLKMKVEKWERQCDDADEVEQQLRMQLCEALQKWKDERALLEQTIEKLKSENVRLTSNLVDLEKRDAAEKVELEGLRLDRMNWQKEKKKKNEEITVLTSRIIALRNELRRRIGGDDLSPKPELRDIFIGDNKGNLSTPKQTASANPEVSITSKRKANKSDFLVRSTLAFQPCGFDESV